MPDEPDPRSKITLLRPPPIPTLVPQAQIGSVLDGALAGIDGASGHDGAAPSESALIVAIACRLDAKRIFEFDPSSASRSTPLAAETAGNAVVTDQTGRMDFDRARLAGMLTAQAIARAEVLRHVDAFHGPDARLVFAPWIGECDLVIVDAAIDRESVKCDSLTALHLAKPGGVVLWCNYGFAPGVTECLNTLYQSIQVLRTLKHMAGTHLCIWQRTC